MTINFGLSIISQHLPLTSLEAFKKAQLNVSGLTKTAIYHLVIQFQEIGSNHNKKKSSCSPIFRLDKMEKIKNKILQSPTKSVWR